MLSLIQVFGLMGYSNYPTEIPDGTFLIPCDEGTTETKHHLYLQGRIEFYSAYLLYVKIGFTLDSNLYCTDYSKDCPVHRFKPPKHGYYTDDSLQRLLSLKQWIYNVYPPHDNSNLDHESTVWNVPNLSPTHFISSALPIPEITDTTLGCTNVAYLNLLHCKKNVGNDCIEVHDIPRNFESTLLPYDKLLNASRTKQSLQMISGKFTNIDFRRWLFRGVNFHPYFYGLNALDAITAALYFEGKLPLWEHMVIPDDVVERTTEIRMNLSAFYSRCAHFHFTNNFLDSWSLAAIDEFTSFLPEDLIKHGLTDFSPVFPITGDNRYAWINNFTLLSHRLMTKSNTGRLHVPLMMDLLALQLMFLDCERPVFFAPVYGMIAASASKQAIQSHEVYAQVPQPSILFTFHEHMSIDVHMEILRNKFIVVPYMPLGGDYCGYFSSQRPPNVPLLPNESLDDLGYRTIPFYTTLFAKDRPFFKTLPTLKIYPEEQTYLAGHCASKWQCKDQSGIEASPDEQPQCLGCLQSVHSICCLDRVMEGPDDDEDWELESGDKTCFLCYAHFGRCLTGTDDTEYGKNAESAAASAAATTSASAAATTPARTAASKKTKQSKKKDATKEKDKTKTPRKPRIPPADLDPEALSQQTRSHFDLPLGDLTTPTQPAPSANTGRRRRIAAHNSTIDKKIDEKNPKYMYSVFGDSDNSGSSDDSWLEDTEVADFHRAEAPVKSHIYSEDEMKLRSLKIEESDLFVEPQTFHEIIRAAIELKSTISQQRFARGNNPWDHRPDEAYSDQDFVHICCLVDRGRELQVDTIASSSKWIMLVVASYPLHPNHDLKHYLNSKKKDIPIKRMKFRVFRAWLKQYLDKFDPDLFDYIKTYTDGLPVLQLPNRMAAHDKESYEQQGVTRRDKLLVPLPKSHRLVSTKDGFGLRLPSGELDPISTDPYGRPSKPPKYDPQYIATCNPPGFEIVPVALPPQPVPAHHLQIRAIRAEVHNKKGVEVTRWLGLQGDKYVSLPREWVDQNFDKKIRAEAIRRATSTRVLHQFIKIPPGDSREDDPPMELRHTKGNNYYYQGNDSNCLVGGLANASFWMLGGHTADHLLEKFIPINVGCWQLFVQHVQSCLPGYRLRKRVCKDVLDLDDTCPFVVQLRSCDKSESHAICIFQGCIYDSASRFVLTKSQEVITWCCGLYGFECHLRVYQLEKRDNHQGNPKKPKRRRH